MGFRMQGSLVRDPMELGKEKRREFLRILFVDCDLNVSIAIHILGMRAFLGQNEI